jgi:hypothetical protein
MIPGASLREAHRAEPNYSLRGKYRARPTPLYSGSDGPHAVYQDQEFRTVLFCPNEPLSRFVLPETSLFGAAMSLISQNNTVLDCFREAGAGGSNPLTPTKLVDAVRSLKNMV